MPHEQAPSDDLDVWHLATPIVTTVPLEWDVPPCAAMDFTVEGTSSIPFTRTVFPTKKVERAWFACVYAFDFLDLEGTYEISYPTGCVSARPSGQN